MYATMDIGTNSCRLLVAEVLENQKLRVLERQLRTTRIGEGMSAGNPLIKPAALERTLAAFSEFARIISKYPVQKILLVATQAVRMAANQAELMAAIKAGTGFEVQVISGEREAWLSYLGAVTSLGEATKPLVIDIGGGSTEFICKGSRDSVTARSLPLGALKLLEQPRTDQELERFLTEALRDFATANRDEQLLVGVGGTCTTLAAVKLALSHYDPERVQGSHLQLTEVEEIYQRLAGLSANERLAVPGIYPGREDIIVPGLQLLLAILRYLKGSSLTVSDQDLLYGLIYEA